MTLNVCTIDTKMCSLPYTVYTKSTAVITLLLLINNTERKSENSVPHYVVGPTTDVEDITPRIMYYLT